MKKFSPADVFLYIVQCICTIQMKLYAEDILWSCKLLEIVIVVFISFMEIISEEDLANIESLNNTLNKISDMLNKTT